MKNVAENSVEINNNIDEVFTYVTNMENFGEWFPEVIKIESVDSQEHGTVGKKYIETVKIPTKGEKQVTIEVVELEKNEKFVTEGKLPPLLPRMTILFTKLGNDKSEVKWKIESRNENKLFGVLFLPIIRIIMKKRATLGMITLKNKLDSQQFVHTYLGNK